MKADARPSYGGLGLGGAGWGWVGRPGTDLSPLGVGRDPFSAARAGEVMQWRKP